MKVLGIDTSSGMVSLSIYAQGKFLLKQRIRDRRKVFALASFVHAALKRVRMDLSDFDLFVLGQGPGSFTGLRVSFSFIKAAALSCSVPVTPIGSFAAIAAACRKVSSKIAVVSDARRSLIYGATFTAGKKTCVVRREKKERLYGLADFVGKHKDYLFVTYDGQVRDEILRIQPQAEVCAHDVYPEASWLIELALSGFARSSNELTKLEPLYVYPKDCQVKNVTASLDRS